MEFEVIRLWFSGLEPVSQAFLDYYRRWCRNCFFE